MFKLISVLFFNIFYSSVHSARVLFHKTSLDHLTTQVLFVLEVSEYYKWIHVSVMWKCSLREFSLCK